MHGLYKYLPSALVTVSCESTIASLPHILLLFKPQNHWIIIYYLIKCNSVTLWFHNNLMQLNNLYNMHLIIINQLLLSCTHLLTQFDLDSIWTFIFGIPASSATVVGSIHNMCTEAAFLLLAMLRSMLNLVSLQASCFRNMHPRSDCWHWNDCSGCHLVVYQRFFTTANEQFWMKWEISDILELKNKWLKIVLC